MRKSDVIFIIAVIIIITLVCYMRSCGVSKNKKTIERITILENVIVDQGLWPAGQDLPESVKDDFEQ